MSQNNIMRNLVLTFTILIGLYTLLGNNIFRFPDQIMWSTNHDLFYKVFIPLFMVIGGLTSFFKKHKNNIFYLTFIAVFVDAINRFAVAINYFYGYLLYKNIPIPPPKSGSIRVVTNLWSSHTMLFVEIILIIMVLRFFIDIKSTIKETSS